MKTLSLNHQLKVMGAACMLLGTTASAFASTSRTYGPSVTTGEVISPNAHFIDFHNPAAGALHRHHNNFKDKALGSVSFGADLEYGDIDDLFALINDLAARIESDPNKGNDGSGGDGGDNGNEGGNGGEDGDNTTPPEFDLDNPELEAWLKSVKTQAGAFGALLGFVASEGYSKVQIGTEIPLLINHDIWGGTLAFKFSSARFGGAVGIVDDINFNSDTAKKAIETILALPENTGEQLFDLSGGLSLTVDKSQGKASLTFDNDSTLLTKAVRTNELSMDYSRHWAAENQRDIYLGIRPRLLRLGTSNVYTRIGDLTDAGQFFDDIFNAELKYKYGWSADIGAIMVKPTYHIGATLTNLYEYRFTFPQMDYGNIKKEKIKQALEASRSYTLERQLKLEGGINGANNRWSINLAVDANDAMDPLRDLNQWFTLSGDYQPQISWLPSIRAGYHKNLKGTRLEYIAVGSTLFKYVDFDLGISQDSVTIKSNDLTRGLIFNLGFNYGF